MPRAPRRNDPLSPADLVEIARHAGETSAAELARRLRKNYFTVAKAVKRLRDGRMRCELTWAPCTECGRPITGPRGRTAHVECEAARTRRKARERRRRRPGQSTPYVARFRRERPQAAARLRARERKKACERWPELPEVVRAAALARAHAADAAAYPVTLAAADRNGAPWTQEEDEIILRRLRDPARDVAIDLGRTLWAVRHRRVRLRRALAPGDDRDPSARP